MSKAGKQLLFAFGEREINATSGRILFYPQRLAAAGYGVEVVTHDQAVQEKLAEHYAACDGIKVKVVAQEDRFWTMQQRDGFAKTFIDLYHDIIIPGTDMAFWKTAAFDDFLWHVSRVVQEPIQGRFAAAFMPVPSAFERPREACDVFYSNVVYYCKQNRVPLVGMQISPVTDVPDIFHGIPDYWLVNSSTKVRYFKDRGIAPKRVLQLHSLRDAHCLDTVDDPLRSLVLHESLELGKERLVVTLVNHPSNRMQIKDIVRVLGGLPCPVLVFFIFVGVSVRELTEKSVFEDLVARDFRQNDVEYFTVEGGGLTRAMMLSDAVLATSYVTPLSVAVKYGKEGIVYNPLAAPCDYLEGAELIADPRRLQQRLQHCWQAKQDETDLPEVVRRVLES